MKKIIAAALAAAMLPVCNPCATLAENESFVVECENYSTATFDVPILKNGEFSGGAFVNLIQLPSAEEYKMVYTFEAPKDATYLLDMRCSELGVTWTSDFSFSINGGKEIKAAEASTRTADWHNSIYGSLLKEYRVGEYDLKKGENTLTVTVDKSDIRANLDNKLGYFADYFKFTLKSGEFKGIFPSENCGVFEKTKTVKYEVCRMAADDKEHSYTYTVNDFWGRTTDSGAFKIAAEKRTKIINLGKYDLGWYKINVYAEGTDERLGYAHFSVVPPLSERWQGDSPFAVDSGASVLLKKDELEDKFMQTIPLAGIKWVRERANWRGFRAAGHRDYDSYITKRFGAIKKYGVKTTQILVTDELWNDNPFTDLQRAYAYQQDLVKNTGGLIDLIEIDNELDGMTSKYPADMYSAYLKAMFLGNADSGGNMKMSMVSLCLSPETTFTDGIMRNDVLNWTDIFNFHAHTDYSEKNKILGIRKNFLESYYDKKQQFDTRDMPNWLTEAGIYIDIGENTELTDDQGMVQARYLVTATLESLAEGVDKFFWFILPKYTEHNKELGTFDANFNPNPAYQAEAICSYVLGKGKYIGKKCDDSAQAYMFDSGENDVLVLWTDAPKKYSVVTDKSVTVTDIMGQSKTVFPKNGKAEIDIAYYPVYVTFGGKADKANYYPEEYKENAEIKRTFNAGERIILQQTFNQNLEDARNKGYLLKNNETEELTLTVNNFNSSEKTVRLSAELEYSDVKFDRDTVTVPAMGKTDVKVSVTPHADGKYNGADDMKTYLTFKAEADGFESSPSVATVRIENDTVITPKYIMDGAESLESFNINNVLDGAETSAEIAEDGSYRFRVQLHARLGWYYPRLKVTNPEKLINSDGMCFWVKADEETEGMGDFKCFLNLSDGRRYYTGNESKFNCSSKWVQAKVKWKDLILFTSPYGAVDIRPFDPSLVESLEIGCNLYPYDRPDKKMSFYLKEPGLFVDESVADESKKIEVSGIEGGRHYKEGETINAVIKLADGVSGARVWLNDEPIDIAENDEREITVRFEALAKGKYTLRTSAGSSVNAVTDKAEFYVE